MPEASPIARQRARERLQNADDIAGAARPIWREMAQRLFRDATRAFARGKDDLLGTLQQSAAEGLTDAMVAAHLKARFDVALQATHMIRTQRLDLISDAILFLQRRLQVTPAQMEELRSIYGDEAVSVSKDLSAFANERLAAEMRESVREGETVQLGVQRLQAAFESLGIAPSNGFTLESIFRTQSAVAYSAGEWNAYQDPAVDEILWGYTYVTVGDDRVRPEHAAMEGVTRAKDDPIWDEWTPPAGYACRCSLVPVFKSDAEAGEETSPEGRPQPDDGWDFNPGKVFEDLLRPQVQASLISRTREKCHHATGNAVLGATRGRERVLLALDALGGHALQRDICRIAQRNKAGVSRIICDLAEDGLVRHDPAGRRGCDLTPKGKARAAALAGV